MFRFVSRSTAIGAFYENGDISRALGLGQGGRESDMAVGVVIRCKLTGVVDRCVALAVIETQNREIFVEAQRQSNA